MRVILPLPQRNNSPSPSPPSASASEAAAESESSSCDKNSNINSNSISKSGTIVDDRKKPADLEKIKDSKSSTFTTKTASSTELISTINTCTTSRNKVPSNSSSCSTSSCSATSTRKRSGSPPSVKSFSSSSSSSSSRKRKLNNNTCNTASFLANSSTSFSPSKPPPARKEESTTVTTKMALGPPKNGNRSVLHHHHNQNNHNLAENNPQFHHTAINNSNNHISVNDDDDPTNNIDNHNCTPININNNENYNNSSNNNDITTTFQDQLRRQKLEMVEQEGDGNCLFRAASLQVYGDAGMHGEVRRRCLDFMAKDQAHFSQFVVTNDNEPFHLYLERKRIDGVHGNNPEIQAISELFNRPVEVFVPDNGATPINIFHAEYKTSDAPIRLSYHDGNHYNAVIDPLCPTAGLGLGLPGLEPGLADRMQLKTAVNENAKLQEELELKKVREESVQFQIKRAMIESEKYSVDTLYKQKTLALSDMEATDFDIEQMVLADSMKSYQSTESRKQSWSNRSTGASKRKSKNDSSSPSHDPFAPTSSSSFASCGRMAMTSSSSPHNDTTNSASFVSGAAASASMATSSNINYSHNDSPGEFDVHGEEYPPIVTELVMNGFELSRVLHAHSLIGDNFDDMLAFLMSSGR